MKLSQIRHMKAMMNVCEKIKIIQNGDSLQSPMDIIGKSFCGFFIGLFLLVTSISASADTSRKFEVGLKQSSYFSESIDQTHMSEYSDIQLRYYFLEKTKTSKSEVDLTALFSLKVEDDQYFVLPEFYHSMLFGEKNKYRFTLGRKKFNWSLFDEYWSLGLWQPQFRADFMNPESQGLFGAFFHHNKKFFQWSLFVSTLYLPDQGPNIKQEDGLIFSSNRWFISPVPEGRLADNFTDIYYDIKYPRVTEVVYNRSMALRARVGQIKQGPWFSLSGAYKPRNQLQMGVRVEQLINDQITSVDLYPQVVFHKLYTAELGYKAKSVKTYFSWALDDPESGKFQDGVTGLPVFRTQYLGLGLEHDLKFLGVNASKVSWGLIKKDEKEVKIKNAPQKETDAQESLVRETVQHSVESSPFNSAFRVGLKKQFLSGKLRKFRVEVDYIYDWIQKGSVLKTLVKYKPQKEWYVTAGFDVLGYEGGEDLKDGFFQRYQGNDRVYGGLTYVF